MTFIEYALLVALATGTLAFAILYALNSIEWWQARQQKKKHEARLKAIRALNLEEGDEVTYNGKVYTIERIDYVGGFLTAYDGGPSLSLFYHKIPDLKKAVKCPMEYHGS